MDNLSHTIFKTMNKEKTKETKDKKNGLILSLKGINITADPYQYILKMGGYTISFHATLAQVFEEIYERKEKENLILNKDKSVAGIIKTIDKTRRWIKGILKPLDGVRIDS